MNLFIIFLTGLSIGGLTCLAVQGGLLTALISERKKEGLTDGFSATVIFLISKFISYSLLGFVLGLLGESFAISEKFQSIIQIVAGIYIFLIALNLLNIHPIFRYVVIQPPKFITKKIRNTSKSVDFFAPALLGFMTIFIPCGTTLGIEALAIASGDPFTGMITMAVFTLGTVPVFLGLGYLTSYLGNTFKEYFLKFTAILLIVIGIISIKGGVTTLGISIPDLSSIFPEKEEVNYFETVPVKDGVQIVNINIYPNYYDPEYVRVNVNQPVRLNLSLKSGTGCTAFFRIPSLGLKQDLAYTREGYLEFTPNRRGKIKFTCSMGMYDGYIDVI